MQLHILTPLTTYSPPSLAGSRLVAKGDWVADLRSFPTSTYMCKANGRLSERTSDLHAMPNYWTIGRDWLLEITEAAQLQKELSIHGVGFWWSLSRGQFTPALTDLGNTFAWIDLLTVLAAEIEPSQLILYGQHDPLHAFCEQIFAGTAIRVKPEQVERRRQWNQPPINRFLIIVRVIIGLFYIIYASLRRPDICYFTTTATFHQAADDVDLNLRELYRVGMASLLRNNGWRVSIAETYGWGATWRNMLKRGALFPTDILFLLSRPAINRITPWRDVPPKWRRKWVEIEPRLAPHFTYRGCDISIVIQPLLRQMFTTIGPQLEIMTELWKIIFSLWKPSLLYLAHHSYGKSTISATTAARMLGIPTIEHQHGIISQNHFAYIAPVEQLSAQAYYPLCDQMTVWGDYVKRIFEREGIYPPGCVHVVGNPLMEALMASLPNRRSIVNQLSIPVDAHVVLYTSNNSAAGLATRLLDSVAQTVDRDDLYWIIKLHPAEKTRTQWEETAKAHGIERIRIIESEVDFYSLLAACDFHVSFASTTIIEAAVAGKLNLGINSPMAPDSTGYAEAGAYLALTPEQLGPTVCELLDSPQTIDALLQTQRAFANDWCLCDGGAQQRILDVVTSAVQGATIAS